MGICVVLLAAAMVAQGVAGLQIFTALKPLLQKTKQLTNEGRQVALTAEEMFQTAKPKVLSTAGEARDLAKNFAECARGWKQGIDDAIEPLLRFRRSFRMKNSDRTTHKER